MDPNVPVDKIDPTEANRGQRARRYLFDQIAAAYGKPVLGEHEEVISSGRLTFRTGSNLVLAEISIIKRLDATVILPSSPGSFCELGLLTAYEEVCGTMLVLLDTKYSNPPGYVHEGPARLATYYHGRVATVDYNDLDAVWKETQDFLEYIVDRKFVSSELRN